jgi:hypothetical protein
MSMRTALAMTSLVSLMTLGCGDKKAEQQKAPDQAATAQTNFDPCALLTSEEIKSAAGWAPDSSQKKPYGNTGSCTYFGPNAMLQNVAILVGQGMPDMSDSRKLADWRRKQYADYKVTNATVEPIEDLGVPAIRNEFGVEGVEMVVGKQLVTVSGLTLKADQVKKLAGFVLARMK